MSRILVFRAEHDGHATIVSAALSILGHEVSPFGLHRYPFEDQHSLELKNDGVIFGSSAHDFDLPRHAFDTVWFRRTPQINIGSSADRLEADDQVFTRRTHITYARWLYSSMQMFVPETRDAFWINRLDAARRSENKLYQLVCARKIGLCTPETLVTNDPIAVEKFRGSVGEPIVCKTLLMSDGWFDSGRALASFTAIVPSEGVIPADSIRIVPAIYQRCVNKQYEVRTVFMREQHFSVRINSQDKEATRVDWRAGPLTCEPYEIPEPLAILCRRLLDEVGLVFACFDFIKTTDGYIFLELNQAGQFLFMEEHCPDIPVLDAFCHLAGFRDMTTWQRREDRLHLADVVVLQEVSSAFEKGRLANEASLQQTGKPARIY